MTKEFEALTRMDDLYCAICPHKKGDCNECEYNQKSNIVYQALTELKAIKEAKPSEAMEDSLKLYKMVDSAGNGKGFNLNEAWKYHKTITQALLKAQELEKIIEEYDLKSCELREALLLYAMYKGEYKGNPLPALKQYKEQEKVLNSIIKHLGFEGSGVEVVKDFINDKEETKYIIKVESKDTGATIHIHLDTEEESKLLKRYFDNENNK